MPSDPPGDPPSGDGSEPVTPAALRTYLGAPDVLSHLRAMLMRRVPRQTVEDVLNDAVVKMCATAALTRVAALGGWVETATLSAVTDDLRKKGLTRAQLAERYEMTEDALKKRFQRFRAKYEDAWKRERTF
jgi:DNA-directed RNA polymerase specialized sigma24 family protein